MRSGTLWKQRGGRAESYRWQVRPLGSMLAAALAVTLLAGCGGGYDEMAAGDPAGPPPTAQNPAPNSTPDAAPVTPSETGDAAGMGDAAGGVGTAAPIPLADDPNSPVVGGAAPTPSTPAPAPGSERVVAEVGVAKQGRSLDNETGIIVEPAKSLFAFKERAVFEIQIPHAMQLYKATNGRNPKSHDEFMQHIIKANQIKLPELPAGQRYVYDPESGELMVERPRS